MSDKTMFERVFTEPEEREVVEALSDLVPDMEGTVADAMNVQQSAVSVDILDQIVAVAKYVPRGVMEERLSDVSWTLLERVLSRMEAFANAANIQQNIMNNRVAEGPRDQFVVLSASPFICKPLTWQAARRLMNQNRTFDKERRYIVSFRLSAVLNGETKANAHVKEALEFAKP